MFAYYHKITGNFKIQGDEIEVTENSKQLLIKPDRDVSFVYDKSKKTLEVSVSRLGGKHWIYLYDDGEGIFFHTSLRGLQTKTSLDISLNRAMLPHFMYNGFIYGKHTLAQGVYKLAPGTKTIFDRAKVSEEKLEITYAKEQSDDLKARYKQILEDAIKKASDGQVDKCGQLHLAISAGYDSNSILYFARKHHPEVPVNCYSVGGCKGVDETGIAEKIVATYDNARITKAYVTPSTREKLDHIVECLEGSVYERGIFLQYELANMLKSHNCNSLICGECADQVFNKNFYEPLPENNFLFDYEHHPKQMGAYVVKKKNELMLNAYGVDVYYPFLDDELMNLAYYMRQLNGTKKVFHIETCKELLPQHVFALLEKQGGSTTMDALFEEGYDVVGNMKKSPYYEADYHITQKYPREEAERDYYLTLAYVESFQKIFCNG